MVLDPLENRFRNAADVKLIVAAQPTVTPYHSPTDARRYEFCTDLIVAGGINDAEQLCGLERELKPVRVEFDCDRRRGSFCDPCVRLRARQKKSASN